MPASQMYHDGLTLNENGDVLFEVAGILESEEGGPTNLAGAYGHYQMVNDQGVERAAEHMADLYVRMTSD